MNELIGYCGLDCGQCDARIATVNNDDELRARTENCGAGGTILTKSNLRRVL